MPQTLAYIYAAVNASYNLTWLPEPVRDWVIEAGVEAAISLYEGMVHGFIAIAPNHPQSAVALEEACVALRARLL